MRSRDCGEALSAALAVTNLRAPGTVAARSRVTSGTADVAAAHALPIDGDAWASDAKAHPIRIEFVWAAEAPALAVRVLNELSYDGGGCDGVTALRLAMHVLEALEGGAAAVGKGSAPFKTTPPFTWGARHVLNALAYVPLATACGHWPFFGDVSKDELAAPTTSAGLRAYYCAPGAAPPPALAQFRGYAAPRERAKETFKQLLDFSQAWGDRVGISSFFSLCNMSPMAAPSIVARARDLLDTEKRYAGVFMPPGYPPSGPIWSGMNHLHINKIFLNNYGTHSFSFSSKLASFNWDWVGMCAPIPGCGCITINGQLCAWTRWTPAGLAKIDDLAAAVFGARVYEFNQIELARAS